MNTELITIAGLSEVQLTPAARHRRNKLLCSAADVESVTTAEQNEAAAVIQSELRDFRLEISKAKKEVKAPVIALGKKIEAVADEAMGAVGDEELRIAALCGTFLEGELARSRAASSAVNPALTDVESARQRALSECSTADERDAINAEYDERVKTAQQTALAAAPKPAPGQHIKEEWDFEVLDALALANARPDLVNIEPKRRDVIEALNQGFRPPGIRPFKKIKAQVR